MALSYHDTSHGYLVYENTATRQRVRVSKDDLVAIGEVCAMCGATNGDAIGRVQAGDYAQRTLRRALTELRAVRDAIQAQAIPIDGDDFLDLLTAIEDLEGILRRVQQIA